MQRERAYVVTQEDLFQAFFPEYKKPKQPRQKFTKEEDEKLIELVGDKKFPNWNEVAQQMPGKSTRQCRERYNNYLAPGIVQKPWTKEEDELVISLVKKHGSNWALIAQHFAGRRTNNHIKNRWYNHLRNKVCSFDENSHQGPMPEVDELPLTLNVEPIEEIKDDFLQLDSGDWDCNDSYTWWPIDNQTTSFDDDIFRFTM